VISYKKVFFFLKKAAPEDRRSRLTGMITNVFPMMDVGLVA